MGVDTLDYAGSALLELEDALRHVRNVVKRQHNQHPVLVGDNIKRSLASLRRAQEALEAAGHQQARLARHEANQDYCEECERSYGPHYRGPCEHTEGGA